MLIQQLSRPPLATVSPLEQSNMTKIEILKSALDARIQEVAGYQINIDNYTLAIQHIDVVADPDLVQFREQLTTLLASETLEQKKSKVMLAVIQQQLEGR
jgi:hypothetical protein